MSKKSGSMKKSQFFHGSVKERVQRGGAKNKVVQKGGTKKGYKKRVQRGFI